MSRINIGSEITGQSTFITNGIIIRSNSNLVINQPINTNTFKTINTELNIIVDDTLVSSIIGDITIKGDDGISDLITISGSKIDSVSMPESDDVMDASSYNLRASGSLIDSVVISVTDPIAVVVQKNSTPGGIAQTTIKN